jgi:hypothetical protein
MRGFSRTRGGDAGTTIARGDEPECLRLGSPVSTHGSAGVGADAGYLEKITGGTRAQRLEVVVSLLMALAVIGAAWASYESSRWGTVQTAQFNASNAARVESNTLSTRGGQKAQVDVALFIQAANAFAADDTELFDFYLQRARDEFKPALSDWIASEPLTNPDAARTPFALPEYQIEDLERSTALAGEATAATAVAVRANQRSDNYVLATVVFAAVLLFAGISSLFHAESTRFAFVGIAGLGFLLNSIWIATMPVTFFH